MNSAAPNLARHCSNLQFGVCFWRWVGGKRCGPSTNLVLGWRCPYCYLQFLENPDLWKWLSGQEQPPEALNENHVFVAVREKVMKNLDSYAAPETRANAGQPWVRGWDDFKKGRDSPIVGNQ